ncbi:hypothetical protein PILCRDRAFT_433559 [Piloderma croceum F 1598]|uniref:Uncharacterized protein n=1 Tax=Piloderma croceum (strain F 1598) TaxID=765440 RepID=A0A0C3FH58_PILCF|nr:hypothetical protein PILCRDRAFT_433559 [Piloderma croceum F 1598]
MPGSILHNGTITKTGTHTVTRSSHRCDKLTEKNSVNRSIDSRISKCSDDQSWLSTCGLRRRQSAFSWSSLSSLFIPSDIKSEIGEKHDTNCLTRALPTRSLPRPGLPSIGKKFNVSCTVPGLELPHAHSAQCRSKSRTGLIGLTRGVIAFAD